MRIQGNEVVYAVDFLTFVGELLLPKLIYCYLFFIEVSYFNGASNC